ncbi:MAG TPA: hypothetical protein EYQ27_17175 [Gemmatimonadetes bacterium]|nr:hypothetical protein [Gemmatimonadota bacterium]
MHQRDFILRMIEQMGASLVALRNRILGRKVDVHTVNEELSGLAGEAGFDLNLLRGFSIETLHMFVSPTGEVEPARCWLMAELLYLDGLQAHVELRIADALNSLHKARVLFSLIQPGGGMLIGFAEAGDRTEEIDELLEQLPES